MEPRVRFGKLSVPIAPSRSIPNVFFEFELEVVKISNVKFFFALSWRPRGSNPRLFLDHVHVFPPFDIKRDMLRRVQFLESQIPVHLFWILDGAKKCAIVEISTVGTFELGQVHEGWEPQKRFAEFGEKGKAKKEKEENKGTYFTLI